MRDHTFEDLWDAEPDESPRRFDPASIADLPAPAQRYLCHALADGVRLASAVRLRMHGEIRLKDAWFPFDAEQVIRWNRGFVWRARVKMHGLSITGSDRWVDGEGAMRWKLLGLVPFVHAEGPDVSRSALGRVQIEAIWLPALLLAPDVVWRAADSLHLGVDVHLVDERGHLDLTLDPRGGLASASIARWGNPGGDASDHAAFREIPFGALVTAERTFHGVTIPSALRVGWYFGTDRFLYDGEFFRVTVDEATFR